MHSLPSLLPLAPPSMTTAGGRIMLYVVGLDQRHWSQFMQSDVAALPGSGPPDVRSEIPREPDADRTQLVVDQVASCSKFAEVVIIICERALGHGPNYGPGPYTQQSTPPRGTKHPRCHNTNARG